MIGPNNNVESITPPTVTITDDDDNNNSNNSSNASSTDDSSAAHRRPTLTLQIHPNEQNNNNFLRIDCSAAAAATVAAAAASPNHDINAIDSDTEINGNCMCFAESGVNLNDIPISALQSKSRSVLSNRLNAIKVILSENGSPRDWRGVLNSIGLSDSVNVVNTKMDPMKEVLEMWLQRQKVPATIGNLQQILGIIDRWDVFDDTNDYFVQDAKTYSDTVSKQMEKRNVTNQNKYTVENVDNPIVDDSNVLTRQDQARGQNGEPPIQYDAYLLYEDSDAPFAAQLFHKMKDVYGLELCQSSDLMAGVLKNDAIMQMISERCNRLIVIFSKAFFESASNQFFVKFAQAISLEQRKRKIIPIITEECDIPSQFTLYHKLRYRYPEPTYFNFWDRLYESVQNVTMRTYTPPTIKVEPPAITMPNQQQAINDLDSNSNTLSVKGKYRSKSPRSSPTTPTSEKKRFWSFPKIGSQTNISSSMLTLDTTDQIYYKENERCHSSLSLNNNSNRSSPIPTSANSSKKNKWLKKLLSPSSGQKLSGESDSSVGPEGTTKKKKWYRKRFHGHSKTREAVAEI